MMIETPRYFGSVQIISKTCEYIMYDVHIKFIYHDFSRSQYYEWYVLDTPTSS